MRVINRKNARGSLKWIRRAVNQSPEVLNDRIRRACRFDPGLGITWVSPVADDDYAEYRDEAFLKRLNLSLPNTSLDSFWPRRGPQWDALGKTDAGEVLLVEAKANVREVVSSATGASEASRTIIEDSLGRTKAFLGVGAHIPWSGKLYQYTNRIAHLYLLRELNEIPAYLLLVYFTGDKDTNGPEAIAEWEAATTVVKGVLGINKRNRLSRWMADVYLDVAELER